MNFEYFIKQLLNGMENGSIYALVALGYTMVYGIVKLINFAHGDFVMVGAYTTLFSIQMCSSLKMPGWLICIFAIIIAMISCSLIAFITEKVAYKPLRNSKRITALITAIAVSLFFQNLFVLIFKSDQREFPTTTLFEVKTLFSLGNVAITNTFLITLSLAVIVMIFLSLFIKKTKTGLSMKAVAENEVAAKLMGVNINKTISVTFLIGGAIAGLAAFMYCLKYGFFNPFIGSNLGLKAFIAAVLGGIGSIPGAMLGGYLIGIIEALSKTVLPSGLSDAVVFTVLILVLLVRPVGLLGKKRGEKV